MLAIRASTLLIDYVATEQVFIFKTLWRYLLYWGGLLCLSDLISPLILLLQSHLADKAVFYINVAIIKKSNRIQGLVHFEKADFHNDVQVILSQAYHKPINLVVTLVGITKDSTVIISCMVLLYRCIGWISFVSLATIILHARVAIYIQKQTWQKSLGRSENALRMMYISSLSFNATNH